LPDRLRIGSVTVNGRPHADVAGEWIVLPGTSGRMQIVVKVASVEE
jgi:hypothetical protein